MRTEEFLEYLQRHPATVSLGEAIAALRDARRMRRLVPATVPVRSEPHRPRVAR